MDKVGAHMTGQDITTPVASSDPIVGITPSILCIITNAPACSGCWVIRLRGLPPLAHEFTKKEQGG